MQIVSFVFVNHRGPGSCMKNNFTVKVHLLDISPIIMTQEQDRAVEAIFRIQFGHYFKVSLSVKCYEHQFS